MPSMIQEMASQKILIVDDDPFVIDMYVLKFKERGFDVETASNGTAALQKYKEWQPEVVLLDVVLPMMDGFEIFREIKKIGRTPVIIFLTNFGEKQDVDRGLKMGADGYIIKAHFTPSEVVEKVQHLLKDTNAFNNS